MATKKTTSATADASPDGDPSRGTANTTGGLIATWNFGTTEPKQVPPPATGSVDTKPPTKLKNSKADYMFGHMTTKVFQVREDQLNELGRANRDTAIASAIATGALAFAVDVTKDLFLAAEAPPDAFIFFAGVGAACWIIGITAAVIAAMKWKERTSLVETIRRQTDFKGQDARPS